MVPKVSFHAHDRNVRTTFEPRKEAARSGTNCFSPWRLRKSLKYATKLMPMEYEYRPMMANVFEVV